MPPNLRFIGFTELNVRHASLIVEQGFPTVRVVRVGQNYWTVHHRKYGAGSGYSSLGKSLVASRSVYSLLMTLVKYRHHLWAYLPLAPSNLRCRHTSPRRPIPPRAKAQPLIPHTRPCLQPRPHLVGPHHRLVNLNENGGDMMGGSATNVSSISSDHKPTRATLILGIHTDILVRATPTHLTMRICLTLLQHLARHLLVAWVPADLKRGEAVVVLGVGNTLVRDRHLMGVGAGTGRRAGDPTDRPCLGVPHQDSCRAGSLGRRCQPPALEVLLVPGPPCSS